MDFQVAGGLQLTGGTLSGPLSLAANPTAPLQAATKQYVDSQTAGPAALPLSGGTLSGDLTLAGNPSAPLQAAPKQYVDATVGTMLPLSGGTLTGALALPAGPSAPLDAAPKEYVDGLFASTLPLAGGTMAGDLLLAGNPTSALGATPRDYVDAIAAASLPVAGGTMTGTLTLDKPPTAPLDAAPKGYVDGQVATALPLSGGTLVGELMLSGNPTGGLAATPKQYVDASVAAALPLTGGTLTGPLDLAANPTSVLQAATKQYVDVHVGATLPLSGGSLTGGLLLSGSPTASLQAAPKSYVDGQIATAVPLAGGTMTGTLMLAGPPSAALAAAPKQYVDAGVASALPLSGGTLTGAMTLAGDPGAPLQAASKQYVDAQAALMVPLSGGTLSGGLAAPSLAASGTATIGGALSAGSLNVVQAGSQTTTLASEIALARTSSGPSDAPVIASNVTVNHSGGAPLSYSNIALTTKVNDAVDSAGNFIDGTTSNVYAFMSNLDVNAVTGSGASATASQHVAVTGAATKKAPAGGYPAGRTGAQVWSLWLPTVDGTNLSSADLGATTGVELDTVANNQDPNNDRKAFQFVLSEFGASRLRRLSQRMGIRHLFHDIRERLLQIPDLRRRELLDSGPGYAERLPWKSKGGHGPDSPQRDTRGGSCVAVHLGGRVRASGVVNQCGPDQGRQQLLYAGRLFVGRAGQDLRGPDLQQAGFGRGWGDGQHGRRGLAHHLDGNGPADRLRLRR